MAATFLASPISRHLPFHGTNIPSVFTEFSPSLEKHVPVYRAKFSGRMKIADAFVASFIDYSFGDIR